MGTSFSIDLPNMADFAIMHSLNPTSLGGGGGIFLITPPYYNIEMKLLKFNFIPLVTILIVLRCCHGNFVMNVSQNGKVKKLAYLAWYWLDLVQIWYKFGIFGL